MQMVGVLVLALATGKARCTPPIQDGASLLSLRSHQLLALVADAQYVTDADSIVKETEMSPVYDEVKAHWKDSCWNALCLTAMTC